MNEDRATRYQRLKRRASMLSLVWSVSLLTVLLWSGSSVALRATGERLASVLGVNGSALWFAVTFNVVALAFTHEIGSLPAAFYAGLVLERRYGLSRERLGAWLRDQVKSFAVGTLLGTIGVGVIYTCIQWSPRQWWLPAGLACAALTTGLANLAPVLLLPLFYRMRPLEREALRSRLLSLANRAGARVIGVYVWGLGDKTNKANAALAGLGSTRRILVSDTMLAEYSDDEIEVVLAHELAHHVHGDIRKGLLLQTVLILGGFFVAARILESSVETLGLRGPSDLAGLPLLLLAAGAVSLAAVPIALAMSRVYERRADRFALELTDNPGAFISAMRRLAVQNLAEERPSAVVKWLFLSHPPIHERIAAAGNFRDKGGNPTSSVGQSPLQHGKRPGTQDGTDETAGKKHDDASLQKAFT